MLFFLGLIIILLVLRDVLHSAVPRSMSTNLCLGPFVVRRILWPPFLSIASMIPSSTWKGEVLGLFAPFSLLALVVIWICLIVAGFGFMVLALASDYSPPVNSLFSAFYVSASAVFTLGSTTEFVEKTDSVRFLAISGALTGLILTASLVSLMFGLISAIRSREVIVSIVSNVGGAPPSGINILETYFEMQGCEYLPAFFDDCHHWCADVTETHRAFPILPYFRSNDPFTSWVTALGAVLDSATLAISVDPSKSTHFSARSTHQIGCKLVNELASLFKLELNEPEEISDEEFHALYLRLQSAGYASNSEDAAIINFRLLRSGYAAALKAISRYLAVPITPITTHNRILFPTLKSSA